MRAFRPVDVVRKGISSRSFFLGRSTLRLALSPLFTRVARLNVSVDALVSDNTSSFGIVRRARAGSNSVGNLRLFVGGNESGFTFIFLGTRNVRMVKCVFALLNGRL